MMRLQPKRMLTAVLLASAFAGSASQAAVSTVALTGTDTDITTYTDGSAYLPLFDGNIHNLGGVDFTFNNGGNNAINGGPVTISTNIADASTVYTLVNSAWGSNGSVAGSITFNGSLGASYTVQYVEGVNVRDHYYGDFNNVTTSPTVTQAVFGNPNPGNAHLDMQTILLPSAFNNQVLTSIVFDSSNGGYPTGQAFLAGVSVSAVPEPSIALMMLIGLCLTAPIIRRRNKDKISSEAFEVSSEAFEV